MPEDSFRLPKSSYEEIVKIVKAYGSTGQETNLDEVAQSAAIDPTIISRNNAFLISVGIITSGKAKGATERGKALAHALNYENQEDISSHWREIATANEFLQKMITAVSIRGGMEESALQSHVAYSAGESRNAGVMAGAGAVIQILKVAGLLKEQDGKLFAVRSGISSIQVRATLKEPEKSIAAAVMNEKPQAVTSQLRVSVQIQIQCKADEVSELGPKIRALLKELREEPKADD